MNIPPTLIVLIAVLLSVGSASAMLWLNYDAIFKKKPDIPAEFTSIEFDADDTSYSPAETHSMNQLSKELASLKQKLLEKEIELDARESAIEMDLESIEKQKKEMSEEGSDQERLLRAFEHVTSRLPGQEELELLKIAIARERARYHNDISGAQSLIAVGESVPDPALPAAEHAAWTNICGLLLNLSESVTRR